MTYVSSRFRKTGGDYGPKIPREWDARVKMNYRISLMVQGLRLCASTAGGVGSTLGQGTKVPYCYTV